MKIPHRLSAAAMLCLLASGCSTLERVDATEKRADGFEAQADAHKRAMESGQVVRDLTTQWINPVPLSGLPGQRSELPPCAVKINRLGSVSLAYVSAFITDQCRIPVVVTPDAQAAMSGSDGGGKTEKISGPLTMTAEMLSKRNNSALFPMQNPGLIFSCSGSGWKAICQRPRHFRLQPSELIAIA